MDYQSRALDIIKDYYAGKVAKRSKVPLINHIIEGLVILDQLGVSDNCKDAYCIHPMVQPDETLQECTRAGFFDGLTPEVLIFAMEYRRVANEYLSKREIEDITEILLSPLIEVNMMLIADKVQNFKDFRIYHLGTHERSAELDQYFRNWLSRLEVSFERFEEWEALLKTI